ncbi:LysR family transcriptional regulator [Thalassotalea ganghwensis]
MDTLDGMRTVVAVVETESFTAASDRLGVSKALVSKYIGQVENSLGVRLFNRTTRRLVLTDAGRSYYEQALLLLEQFDAMVDHVTESQTIPKGTIRISAPVAFGETQLAPLLPKFLRQYPELSIDLRLTNGAVDMIEEGIDLRLRIGGVTDSTMIAREVCIYPLIMCASPDYLAEHGTPTQGQDISEHQCVIDSNFRIGNHWPIISPNGDAHTIEVHSIISANSPTAVKSIAQAGGGIAMIPAFIVEQELKDRSLVKVLPEHSTLEFSLLAIYPHRKYVARKVRCFLDFIFAEFKIDRSKAK